MKKEIAVEKNMNSGWNRTLEKIGRFWTFGVLFVIVVIFSIIEPKMFTAEYWSSTINYLSEILLLGMAETFVIITAGIDLSVGAVEGCAGVATALIIKASGTRAGRNRRDRLRPDPRPDALGIAIGMIKWPYCDENEDHAHDCHAGHNEYPKGCGLYHQQGH